MQILDADIPSFNAAIQQRTVLVDFWAQQCIPCQELSPVLEALASDFPDIQILKVNVDTQPILAAQYMIFSLPTLLLFKNGNLQEKAVGIISKESIIKKLHLNLYR